MPVTARRFVRRMRGGAQAQLLEADDGRFYVTKFTSNPQHRRVLINDWLGQAFLRHLGICVPRAEVVEVSSSFIAQNPELCFQLGSSRSAVPAGRHFGSATPGDPGRLAVYDYLPDTLLAQVVNLDHFAGVLAFDKWTGNADARQAVFFRAAVRDYWDEARFAAGHKGFLAWMIDHGYLFDGPNWDFTDSPLQGLYHRKFVYDGITRMEDFEPWLARIESFPESVADEALRSMPSEWIGPDHDALMDLLERLFRRRKRVGALLRATAASARGPFAHWRG